MIGVAVFCVAWHNKLDNNWTMINKTTIPGKFSGVSRQTSWCIADILYLYILQLV